MQQSNLETGTSHVKAQEKPVRQNNWYLVFLLSLACTLCAFEVLMTNLNLNYIVAGIGITPDEFTWIIAIFFLGQFAGVALSARLIACLRTRLFLQCMMVSYCALELIAACSTNSFQFALSRLGAGFINGAITTASLIFIIRKLPHEKRLLTYFFFSSPAIFVVPFSFAVCGFALEDSSWRLMYQISAIVGAALLVAFNFVRASKPSIKRFSALLVNFDGLGFILLFAAAAGYATAMLRGTTENWFDSPFIQSLCLLSFLLTIAFCWQQRRRKRPFLVSVRLLQDPHILAMAALNAVYGVLLAYPLVVNGFLVLTQDANPIQVGGTLAAAAFCAPFFVASFRRLDFRWLIFLGLAACAAGGLINANLTRWDDGSSLLLSQLVRSFGLTLFLWPLWNLIMSNTKRWEHDEAAKIYTISRVVGLPAGIAVVGASGLWRDNFHSQHVTETLNDSSIAQEAATRQHQFLQAGSTQKISTRQAEVAVAKHVRQEVQVLAYNDTFWLFGAIALAAVVPLLFVRSNVHGKSIARIIAENSRNLLFG